MSLNLFLLHSWNYHGLMLGICDSLPLKEQKIKHTESSAALFCKLTLVYVEESNITYSVLLTCE